VTPDDIKALFEPVLAHRLVLSAEAGRAGGGVREVIAEVVRTVAVP
jgi:MoxR-like ATPase